SHVLNVPMFFLTLQFLFPIAEFCQRHLVPLLKLSRLYQSLAGPGEGSRLLSPCFFPPYLLTVDIHQRVVLAKWISRFHYIRSTQSFHWAVCAMWHPAQGCVRQIRR